MTARDAIARRQLLAMLGLATMAAAHPLRAALPKPTLGLQAITIMNALPVDLPRMLRDVRRTGYRVLETIGALGLPPSALADRLAEAGLSTNAQHLCPASFYPAMAAWSRGAVPMADIAVQLNSVYALDRLPAILDEGIATARLLGQRYLVWSSLPAADLTDSAGLTRIIRAFDDAGRTCAREGLVFAFHNGSRGFAPVAGQRPYDLLLAETDSALVKMELDIYWAIKMGIDPVAILARQPGRFALCHLKNMDDKGEVAPIPRRPTDMGRIDFPMIVAAARRAGIMHFYFEQDQAPDPIRTMADARAMLAPLMR
jgi:sugar phosphate isomerase/epimerase